MSAPDAGVADAIHVALNATAVTPVPDGETLKGPDPTQWDDPEGRQEPVYDAGDGMVKGPSAAARP